MLNGREMLAYAERVNGEGRYGETEDLLTRIGVGEYLAQIFGGIAMSQGEFVRLPDFGLAPDAIAAAKTPEIDELIAAGNTVANRARLVDLVDHAEASATVGTPGLDDTLEAIREEIRKYAEAEVVPHAHEWHLKNEYIPLEIIQGLGDLGVFGLTMPKNSAAWVWARKPCAWSPRSFRAPISASARWAPARKSPAN